MGQGLRFEEEPPFPKNKMSKYFHRWISVSFAGMSCIIQLAIWVCMTVYVCKQVPIHVFVPVRLADALVMHRLYTTRYLVSQINGLYQTGKEYREYTELYKNTYTRSSGVSRNFFSGRGVQHIQLRTEDRENGDLGAVAP
jgi:hypothetical protein